MLEKARDEAVTALMNPDRIPMSGETVTLGGLRLIMRQELDEVELVMAGQTARLVCAATGVTADIENEVRRQVAHEQEQEKRARPVHLQQLGDGNVSAVPNVTHPATPQAYHPPQYPAHLVTPATTPGWAT